MSFFTEAKPNHRENEIKAVVGKVRERETTIAIVQFFSYFSGFTFSAHLISLSLLVLVSVVFKADCLSLLAEPIRVSTKNRQEKYFPSYYLTWILYFLDLSIQHFVQQKISQRIREKLPTALAQPLYFLGWDDGPGIQLS